MAMPRVLSLDEEGRLVQQPVAEVRTLRQKKLVDQSCQFTDGEYIVVFAGSDTLEIIAKVESQARFGVRHLRPDDGKRSVDLLLYHDKIHLADLSFSASDKPHHLPEKPWPWKTSIHIFINKRLIEVFIYDGRRFVSKTVERNPADNGVSFIAEQRTATIHRLQMWELSLPATGQPSSAGHMARAVEHTCGAAVDGGR